MRKYVCVDDIGNIVNPLIVAGQVHGGLVQGIAQALWEEAVHDDAGTLVSASFVDYLVPTAADTISFDIDHTTSPSTTNTLGTKGVGEAGTIASTPAVVNAVVDALRPFGVNDVRMPCTPERIYKAIHAQRRRRDRWRCHRGRRRAALRRGRHADRTDGELAVIPAQFDYVAPTTLEEALSALAEHGDDAKIIAGGQSLLPVLRMRLNAPGGRHRPRQDRGAARRARRRRRDRHRRDDHARRRAARRPGARQRVRDHQGRRAARRPAGAAPRHLRRRARARRPGRRPRGAVASRSTRSS